MDKQLTKNFPQVLLLGNGLNRAFGGESWGKIIEEIWQNNKIKFNDVVSLPFPLQAIVGTDDKVETILAGKPKSFYGLEDIGKLQSSICRLLNIKFDHILTTNYSYEIERVGNPSISQDGEKCKNIMKHTSACERSESKYLLHTYNSLVYEGYENKVWHIHGEMRKPSGVILGHYSYGRLLGKYMEEMKKAGNKYQNSQKNGKTCRIDSWLDAFILGDVYILGFGLDVSEMDLWWLINRKKREKAEHGKIVIYEPSYGQEIKESLLDTYGVKTNNLGYRTEVKGDDYAKFYEDAISDIQCKVELSRR